VNFTKAVKFWKFLHGTNYQFAPQIGLVSKGGKVMEPEIKTKALRIGGMTCINCQNKIAKKLRNTAGIEQAEVNYNDGKASVTYDADIISLQDIRLLVEKLGYTVLSDGQRESDGSRILGVLMIVAALYILIQRFGLTDLAGNFPLPEAGLGLGVLFVIGLVTSVHCVAMCGGINLSQCLPQRVSGEAASRTAALRPSFLYNLGRVLAYTVVGGLVGAIGSGLSLSGNFRGLVQIFAGVFMVVMGVNMLGIFPRLRRFTPRMPGIFARRIEGAKGGQGPFYVGLLNGLMPCGPLQAMQLYALSTGSPVQGALSMLAFSLGTVPLMFGLGALSSVLSRKFTQQAMTVGAVLVVALGLSMFSNGWNLSGFSLPSLSTAQANIPSAAVPPADGADGGDGVQLVNSTLAPGRYPAIAVQAGIPVKWTIDAPQGTINGCNQRVIIPAYGIEHQFILGENVIEFTPDKTGKFSYSCWMGMIRGSIQVVDDLEVAGAGPTAAK
jgi:sulfite exporter TauE/SafE/copper chaperone CopZ